MIDHSLPPLRFEPIFQYRLWGGRRLAAWMHAELPDDEPIGEAWILSDRDDHPSRVAEGLLKGWTLPQLMAGSRELIMGRLATRFDRFPLLLKFLDVREMLSVQVHPADGMAKLIPRGETGKTEAWVVLAADPGARIYAGLKPGATRDGLAALTAETAPDLLGSFRPLTDQAVLIKGGTVHALGDGVMVFEIQENSDVTYRLYDWGHVDARTGKPRDLQIDQALDCIDFDQGEVRPAPARTPGVASTGWESVFDTRHFVVNRQTCDAPFAVGAEDEPRILVCLGGAGRIDSGEAGCGLGRGGVALLPASLGVCNFRPDGPVDLLEIAIPDAA